MPNTIPGLSRFRQGVILSQHRIEEILLASLSEHPEVEIQRQVVPDDLIYEASEAESENAYPITVSLRRADCEKPVKDVSPEMPLRSPATPFTSSEYPEPGHRNRPSIASVSTNGHDRMRDQGQVAPSENEQLESMSPEERINGETHPDEIETVKAKYVIGCDGAHSWTRSQLGIKMNGEQTDFVWGVIDIIPITNFPDIRSRCAIHSAKSGSIMIIPREGGRLIRIYCQLTEVSRDEGGKFDRSAITEERIFQTAQEIMKPYTLEYKYCANWTVYQVGRSADDEAFALLTSARLVNELVNGSALTIGSSWRATLSIRTLPKRKSDHSHFPRVSEACSLSAAFPLSGLPRNLLPWPILYVTRLGVSPGTCI